MRRGLLYVRFTPIAIKLCAAEKFRDVPMAASKAWSDTKEAAN